MSRLKDLSDNQLLLHLNELVQRNCGLEAELVAHLLKRCRIYGRELAVMIVLDLSAPP